MGDGGLEPNLENKAFSNDSGQGEAKCEALDAHDDDLARIISLWPTIPSSIKQRIAELVESEFAKLDHNADGGEPTG